ncbi:MAG: ferric reductase-like transmembrane domain-containing protein [bacterium]
MALQTKIQTPITIKNSIGEWLIAITINYLIFQAFWSYNVLWRGSDYSLDSANPALAVSALFIFALSLLFGPFYRTGWCQKWVIRLRRPIAMIATLLAFTHSYLVIKSYITTGAAPVDEEKTCVILGITALVILLIMLITSYPFALRMLNAAKWRALQLTASILLILTLNTHYLVLDYYQVWQHWMQSHNHPVPPATMVVNIFCAIVLLVRVIDAIRNGMKKKVK